MVEKMFRVLSNSQECLDADTLAMALLRQVTLNPKEPDVKFVVVEAKAPLKD